MRSNHFWFGHLTFRYWDSTENYFFPCRFSRCEGDKRKSASSDARQSLYLGVWHFWIFFFWFNGNLFLTDFLHWDRLQNHIYPTWRKQRLEKKSSNSHLFPTSFDDRWRQIGLMLNDRRNRLQNHTLLTWRKQRSGKDKTKIVKNALCEGECFQSQDFRRS